MRDGAGRVPHRSRRSPRRGIAFRLSRQQALLLRLLARCNADDGYLDIRLHGSAPVTVGPEWALFQRFPRRTYRLPASWRLKAARSFDDLADDLEAGLLPRPRSVSERLALALTIEDAANAEIDPAIARNIRHLPGRPEGEDWAAIHRFLAADAAVRDPRRVPPSAAWFVPFAPELARDPLRGYRR